LIYNSFDFENEDWKEKGRSATEKPAKVEDKAILETPIDHLEDKAKEANDLPKKRKSTSKYRYPYVERAKEEEEYCAQNLDVSTDKQKRASKIYSRYVEDTEGKEEFLAQKYKAWLDQAEEEDERKKTEQKLRNSTKLKKNSISKESSNLLKVLRKMRIFKQELPLL